MPKGFPVYNGCSCYTGFNLLRDSISFSKLTSIFLKLKNLLVITQTLDDSILLMYPSLQFQPPFPHDGFLITFMSICQQALCIELVLIKTLLFLLLYFLIYFYFQPYIEAFQLDDRFIISNSCVFLEECWVILCVLC